MAVGTGQGVQCGERSGPNTHRGKLPPTLLRVRGFHTETRVEAGMTVTSHVPQEASTLRNVNTHCLNVSVPLWRNGWWVIGEEIRKSSIEI